MKESLNYWPSWTSKDSFIASLSAAATPHSKWLASERCVTGASGQLGLPACPLQLQSILRSSFDSTDPRLVSARNSEFAVLLSINPRPLLTSAPGAEHRREVADHAVASATPAVSCKSRLRSRPQLTGERTAEACDIALLTTIISTFDTGLVREHAYASVAETIIATTAIIRTEQRITARHIPSFAP
jgi:hypothetical protein